MNSTKSLIFDLTKVLLSKHLVLTYSLIAKVMYYQILFTELKSSYQFLVVVFQVELWLLIIVEKRITLMSRATDM